MPLITARPASAGFAASRGAAARPVGASGRRPRDLWGVVSRLDLSQTFQDSAATTIAVPGDPLGYAADPVGGFHYLQATNGSRPTLSLVGGQRVASFDGTASRLHFDGLSALFTGSNPVFTVVAVVRSSSFSAVRCWFSLGRSSSAQPFHTGQFGSVPDHRHQRRADGGTSGSLIGGKPTLNTWHLVVLRMNGTWGDTWVDGRRVAQGSLDVQPATLNQATLGALRTDTNSQHWFGDMAEFEVYGRFLPSALMPDLAMWKRATFPGA